MISPAGWDYSAPEQNTKKIIMESATGTNPPPLIGIDAVGYYIPKKKLSSEEIAVLSGIPVDVFTEKIGFKQVSVADDNEHPSEMGIKAASDALKKSKIFCL